MARKNVAADVAEIDRLHKDFDQAQKTGDTKRAASDIDRATVIILEDPEAMQQAMEKDLGAIGEDVGGAGLPGDTDEDDEGADALDDADAI